MSTKAKATGAETNGAHHGLKFYVLLEWIGQAQASFQKWNLDAYAAGDRNQETLLSIDITVWLWTFERAVVKMKKIVENDSVEIVHITREMMCSSTTKGQK